MRLPCLLLPCELEECDEVRRIGGGEGECWSAAGMLGALADDDDDEDDDEATGVTSVVGTSCVCRWDHWCPAGRSSLCGISDMLEDGDALREWYRRTDIGRRQGRRTGYRETPVSNKYKASLAVQRRIVGRYA